jgi:uncharacterized protein with PIN domain
VSRIEKAYRERLRSLLQRIRARHIEEGLRWLENKARRLSRESGVSFATALAQMSDELVSKTRRRTTATPSRPVLFWCDAGLGGLARWLRAAGYEAKWEAGIDDDDLLRQAQNVSATVLTTDSLMMERRVVRDGIISALWLPPTLKIPEQMEIVFREFDLAAGEPRCMECGGELRRAEKESLRDRIPPKTYRWLDEYFLCARCGKLFWRGTHWDKISRELVRIGELKVGRTSRG